MRNDIKKRKTAKRVIFLGWCQVSASVILLFNLTSETTVTGFVVTIFAIGLNFAAGYLSIKGHIWGYKLSIVNQTLQLFSFKAGQAIYYYSGIGGVYFSVLSEGATEFKAEVRPGLTFIWGELVKPVPGFFGIDFLAVFFIAVLLSAIRYYREDMTKVPATPVEALWDKVEEQPEEQRDENDIR